MAAGGGSDCLREEDIAQGQHQTVRGFACLEVG